MSGFAIAKLKARLTFSKTINVNIESPGGSVFLGLEIMDKIRELESQGFKVRCTVQNMAASMGFNILQACTERIALNKSVLMSHPAYSNAFIEDNEVISALLFVNTKLANHAADRMQLPFFLYALLIKNALYVDAIESCAVNAVDFVKDYDGTLMPCKEVLEDPNNAKALDIFANRMITTINL
jgi:hypothetical protein